MLRQGKRILIGGLPFFSSGKENSYETATDAEIQRRLEAFEASSPTSGWDRVKYVLFQRNEYGETSPHAANIMQATVASLFAGASYGGYKKSQVAYLEFVRTNQASAFLTHNEAKKRLQDRVMVNFLKGALQLGWRTGLFSFMFMTVSNVVALYRNKDGIMEYTSGGAAAGVSYRLHVGLRAMIVGGILGAAFGTIGGVINSGLLHLVGVSMTDVRHAQYTFLAHRERRLKRIQDISKRHSDFEGSEVFERIARDENAGKLSDDLNSITLKEGERATETSSKGKVTDVKNDGKGDVKSNKT